MAGPQRQQAAAARGEVFRYRVGTEHDRHDLLAAGDRHRHRQCPGDQPAQGALGGERLEYRRHAFGRMRERGQQGQSADPFRMSERQGQRDRAAQRVADHQRAFQAEPVDQRGQRGGLGRQVGAGAGLARRIAGARAVHRNHAEVARQGLDHAVGKVAELAGQAVHQQDGRTLAALDHVQARARHVDEAAGGRHTLFDAPRDAAGEPGQAGAQHEQQRESMARRMVVRTLMIAGSGRSGSSNGPAQAAPAGKHHRVAADQHA